MIRDNDNVNSNLESNSNDTAHNDGMLQNSNTSAHSGNDTCDRNGHLEDAHVTGNFVSTIINNNNDNANRILNNRPNPRIIFIRNNDDDSNNLNSTSNGTTPTYDRKITTKITAQEMFPESVMGV